MKIERTVNGAEFVRTDWYDSAADGKPVGQKAREDRDYYVHAQMLPAHPQRFERIHVRNIKGE